MPSHYLNQCWLIGPSGTKFSKIWIQIHVHVHIMGWVTDVRLSLVMWFCYQLIAKSGTCNKTAAPSWPDPFYVFLQQNVFRYVVCRMVAISFNPHFVNLWRWNPPATCCLFQKQPWCDTLRCILPHFDTTNTCLWYEETCEYCHIELHSQ